MRLKPSASQPNLLLLAKQDVSVPPVPSRCARAARRTGRAQKNGRADFLRVASPPPTSQPGRSPAFPPSAILSTDTTPSPRALQRSGIWHTSSSLSTLREHHDPSVAQRRQRGRRARAASLARARAQPLTSRLSFCSFSRAPSNYTTLVYFSNCLTMRVHHGVLRNTEYKIIENSNIFYVESRQENVREMDRIQKRITPRRLRTQLISTAAPSIST